MRNDEDRIYDPIIHPNEDDLKVYEADQSTVELLVFQQFDFKKLIPKNLVELRQEGKTLDRLHLKAAEVAKSIRKMRNKDGFAKQLKEKVGDIISEWEKSQVGPGSIAREIFVGSEKPGGEFLKKMAEQAAGPVVAGATVGGLTTGALLGATAGFGIALIVHAKSAVRTVIEREKNSPYHTLTLLEKSGAAFTAGG